MVASETKRSNAKLVSSVRKKLRGADGVRVVGSGSLSRPNGHPRGTRWVEIEADSILDCDVAEFRLAGWPSLSPAPWESGWTLAENRQQDPSFRLRIYARND